MPVARIGDPWYRASMASPRTASAARPEDSLERSSRIIRRVLLVDAAYLVVTLMPMLRWSITQHRYEALIAHVLATLAALVFAIGDFSHRARPFRDWLPIVFIPLLYTEVRWVIAGIGIGHHDQRVQWWDAALFPSNPSKSLAVHYHAVAISEILHLAYLAYYFIIFVPPAILWFRGRRREFAATVAGLSVVYVLCFLTFMIFPVDGPRFLNGPSDAPPGIVRGIAVSLLQAASSRGTAFPSSHAAAAVIASLYALWYQRKTGLVVAVTTLLLCVGAVYGGFHYAVDIVAGVAYAALALPVAWLLQRTDSAPPPRARTPDLVKVQVMQARMARGARSSRTSAERPAEDERPGS